MMTPEQALTEIKDNRSDLQRKMDELDALLARLDKAITNLEEEMNNDNITGHEG